MSDETHSLAILVEDGSVGRLAETRGALGYCVEHRLDVRRRPADHAENLSGGSLLGETVGELAVARLERLGQAGVLDGDGGLVGEGLEERDLLGREGANP